MLLFQLEVIDPCMNDIYVYIIFTVVDRIRTFYHQSSARLWLTVPTFKRRLQEVDDSSADNSWWCCCTEALYVCFCMCVQEKQLRSIRDTSSHKAVTLMHCSWLTDSALKLLRSSVGSNSFINVQNKSGTNFRTFTAGCWKKTYKCKKVYQAADNFEILVFSFSQT